MFKISLVFTALIPILGVVSVTQAHAYTATQPAYLRGHYTAKIEIKFKDNCWSEAYVRMADRDNNHRLLNKITFFNHPTSGESKPINVQLKFEASNIQGESQRFRAYVIVDDGFSQVNKYIPFDPKIKIYHIHFLMNTNTAACA